MCIFCSYFWWVDSTRPFCKNNVRDHVNRWMDRRASFQFYSSLYLCFCNGDILSIQSTSQRSDIVVRISKDGIVLYEARVSASEAEYTMIDLGGLDADAYVLDLTNQWGDHLYGIFEKEGSNSL